MINHPTLGDIEPQDLSGDERCTLEKSGFAFLNKIHDLGVYHHDITAPNLFWDRSDHLMLADYETATFKDDFTIDYILEWGASDKGQLMSILREYGIEDKRPSAPSWFEGWKLW